jgi:hypothetical protein
MRNRDVVRVLACKGEEGLARGQSKAGVRREDRGGGAVDARVRVRERGVCGRVWVAWGRWVGGQPLTTHMYFFSAGWYADSTLAKASKGMRVR